METFLKNEFNDSTSMMNNIQQYHSNEINSFQSCKKKLNFSNSNNNLAKLPIKHETGSVSSSMGFKPSNTKRNERERKRVKTINDYFSKLQKFLPNSKQTTKKLSKVETLKAAIDYIEYLQLNTNKGTQLGNHLAISTPSKVQKESRNKLLNKLNNNNNIENTSSSISLSASPTSSTISTSSCYSTPTVSPLQISHNSNNVLNNNTNNHNNIQVHVNINSNNLQVPAQQPNYHSYQQLQSTNNNTSQQPILQYTNNSNARTATKTYYNNSSTPSSPNNLNNGYYPIDEAATCYNNPKSLLPSNENYNNISMYQQPANALSQHYPVNNASTEFIHQNYYHQQSNNRQLANTSTRKCNLDLTSYSTDDGIDAINSSTASSTADDYTSNTPAIYTTSNGQHLSTPSNTSEICSRQQNYNAKTAECYLTDNLLLDFM